MTCNFCNKQDKQRNTQRDQGRNFYQLNGAAENTNVGDDSKHSSAQVGPIIMEQATIMYQKDQEGTT